MKILFSGKQNNNIIINDSVQNYDFIIIITEAGNGIFCKTQYSSPLLLGEVNFSDTLYQHGIGYSFKDNTTLIVMYDGYNYYKGAYHKTDWNCLMVIGCKIA